MNPSRQDAIDGIMNKFTYHAPTGDEIVILSEMRNRFRELALYIIDVTPICPDQTVALRKLHETSMAANATLVCNREKEKTT